MKENFIKIGREFLDKAKLKDVFFISGLWKPSRLKMGIHSDGKHSFYIDYYVRKNMKPKLIGMDSAGGLRYDTGSQRIWVYYAKKKTAQNKRSELKLLVNKAKNKKRSEK